jgi:hypothetical protein
MSKAKGNAAPQWVAKYLRPWWPHAEKTPNGRPGRDIQNTPGVAWEVKTSPEWSHKAIKQAAGYAGQGELPLVLYLPPGCGEAQVADALVILPLRLIMPVLVESGYAPQPNPERGNEEIPW